MLSLPVIRRTTPIVFRSTCNFQNFSTSLKSASIETTNEVSTDASVPKYNRKDKRPQPPFKRRTTIENNFGLVNIFRAIDILKETKWSKMDETLEVFIETGLDPRKPNQSVKGVAKLPFGTGKEIKVCVICGPAEAAEAKNAGADLAGGEDVIAQIQAGNLNFQTLIATPEMMPLVGKIGKILGPKGLMPNPKTGTVTKDVAKAVKISKSGAAKFKTEKKGFIQAGVGKLSFPKDNLLANIRSFMIAVMDSKPEQFKGRYFKSIKVSSTMGICLDVDLNCMDPSNPRFLLDLPPVAPKTSSK